MTPRTELAAEVPSLELCREMAATPALAKAFKVSYAVWFTFPDMPTRNDLRLRASLDPFVDNPTFPAPTVRDMLVVLTDLAIKDAGLNGDDKPEIYDWQEYIFPHQITDPDALARALIEAAK